MEKKIELKPCPFCGHTEELRVSQHGIWGIHCICGASICGYDSGNEAIEAWNTRKIKNEPD